jgi:hypothetical protein
MVFVRPGDENTIEGNLVAREGDRLTLEVITSPTGRAADLRRETVEIRLESDAVVYLNGKTNPSLDDALAVGNVLRVQSAWSGAVLVRDIDMDKVMLKQEPVPTPYFIVDQMIAPEKIPFVHPERLEATENETVAFKAYAMATESTVYQWYRNGDPIPGADEPVYHRVAEMADNGADFVCTATGPGGTAKAPAIELTVTPDTSELVVRGASIADRNTIQLTFNKPVDQGSAEQTRHYALDQGVTVKSVHLTGDRRTVILNTTPLKPHEDYTIRVRNVHDLSSTPNVLADSTEVPVSFRVAFRYLRFTTVEKMGGLNARIKQISFQEGDASYGDRQRYFGVGGVSPETAFHAFHPGDSASTGEGEGIGVDMGPGNEITPDAMTVELEAASGRDVKRWKLEASNDREYWVLLHESTPEQTLLNGRSYRFPLELSGLQPEDILTGAQKVQTITFPDPGTLALSDSPVPLNGSASSGLPVAYEVLAGPAEVDGKQLTLTGHGDVRVRAVQTGSGDFYPAHPVVRTFRVVAAATSN